MNRAPLFHILVLMSFIINMLGPVPLVQAQELNLPIPGVRVGLSPQFNAALLKGIKVHLDNPLKFDFIVDSGDSGLKNEELKEESNRLIKYFLVSLTVPEDDLWVNLSPYEKDRIIPQSFGQTEMGRDLLAEDYMLKQITASLIYPESKIGRNFWAKVYQMAKDKYGTSDIPVNTFNKVWVVPEKAVVYENGTTAYVTQTQLKVMLEQDYLSLEKNVVGKDFRKVTQSQAEVSQIGSQVVREIVIPELTQEVNEGKNFAPLRQVYHSLILADWYKKRLKESILNKVYSDRNKISGVNVDDKDIAKKIWIQYVKAFKKGAYNYIKDDMDPVTHQTIPRKYFSGGFGFGSARLAHAIESKSGVPDGAMTGSDQYKISVQLDSAADKAMVASPTDSSISAQDLETYIIKLRDNQGQSPTAKELFRRTLEILDNFLVLRINGAPDIEDVIDELRNRRSIELAELLKQTPTSNQSDGYRLARDGLIMLTPGKVVMKENLTPSLRKTLEAKRVRSIDLLRRAQSGDLPVIINFGDKHGNAQDLQAIGDYVEYCISKKIKVIVSGEGDGFDRGPDNVGVFDQFKRLKQLEAQNPELVKVHLLWGNHDEMLAVTQLFHVRITKQDVLGVVSPKQLDLIWDKLTEGKDPMISKQDNHLMVMTDDVNDELKKIFSGTGIYTDSLESFIRRKAMDFNSKAMGFMGNGGLITLEQFKKADRNSKELALFMLENFEILYVDELGEGHTHAPLRMDEKGNPLIPLEILEGYQKQLKILKEDLRIRRATFERTKPFSNLNDLKKRSELLEEFLDSVDLTGFQKLLETTHDLFWNREEDSFGKIMMDSQKGMVDIDKDNEAKTGIKAWSFDIQAQFLRREKKNRALGINFKQRTKGVLKKKEAQHFLDSYGWNGHRFGHIHYAVDFDGFKGVDNGEQEEGHYLFNKDGFYLQTVKNGEKKIERTMAEYEQFLIGDIQRLNERLSGERLVPRVLKQDPQTMITHNVKIILETLTQKFRHSANLTEKMNFLVDSSGGVISSKQETQDVFKFKIKIEAIEIGGAFKYTLLESDSRDEKGFATKIIQETIKNLNQNAVGDKAMVNGGIDLTSKRFNVDIHNAGKDLKFHIDSAQLSQMNIEGFIPVIISIQPTRK
ncbi:MAG: metallophosphoesterase [Candidatus Omnitrophica bacterium]|nr:metallophosphoesterase [Candidatus Omnitrophota bacterium]